MQKITQFIRIMDNKTEDKLAQSQIIADESTEIIIKSATVKDLEDLKDQLTDARTWLRDSQAKNELLEDRLKAK